MSSLIRCLCRLRRHDGKYEKHVSHTAICACAAKLLMTWHKVAYAHREVFTHPFEQRRNGGYNERLYFL